MTANSEEEDISLAVLSHGLWGVKSHMDYIENQLKKKYKDKLEIIESMIVRLGKNGKKVKKISFVGYSLGGLIMRYAIGILGERGFFDTIQPQSFVTFATPHMGVRLPSSSLLSLMFNLISGRLVSRSGEQLQLVDNYKQHKPLLEIMSDPSKIMFVVENDILLLLLFLLLL
ncbi:MAG: putative serine esterase-domain-containing protein [Benjaminiella poitrasii]|nr:MAG: putative serine esterase-domain-containing protein [Benjaminiella poitrasii]